MENKLFKFYRKTTSHPGIIVALFLTLTLVALLVKPLIGVDYDIMDYLPDSAPSSIASDLLLSEYKKDVPNARVMVKNVSIAQALDYKAKLEAVDGVSEVTWLDDSVSIDVPLSMDDPDTVETYYKDGNALFSVTIEGDKRVQACDDIRAIIGDDNCLTGNAVATATATVKTIDEINKISAFTIVFVLFVLLMTTESWAEPFIVMIGLGVAVGLNAGSNIIFGNISFVTNSAGNILQLAVSLDYSVFLIQRFCEERKNINDPKEAMITALSKSTTSILSSGLTTLIGFLAICLMRFKIGPDVGLALAKGIVISLITVFIFTPSLVLLTYKFIDKSMHKRIVPQLRALGRFVLRFMFPAVVIFVLLMVPSYLATNANDFYYGASHIFGSDTKLGQDTDETIKVFGQTDTYVLMVPKGDLATEESLSAELNSIPEITDVISYVDSAGVEIPTQFVDSSVLNQLISDNYSRFVISVDADYEGEEAFNLVENIRGVAQKYYPDTYYLAGQGVSTYDLMNIITDDMIKVNAIAIGAVFIILFIMMKSVSLPAILVLGIETAIFVNLSIPYYEGKTVFYIAFLIISSIQLGATVDYAILFTNRYKEFRETLPKKQAIIETATATNVSIMTSASVLTVVGFLMGAISSNGIISQLGLFLGKGTLCSLCVVLFALPGLLYIFDGFILRKAKHISKINLDSSPNELNATTSNKR